MGTIYFDLLSCTFPIDRLIWWNRYDCYLNLSQGLEPNLVSNNIALRELLNVDSLGLEVAKWNNEPWDALLFSVLTRTMEGSAWTLLSSP